MLLEHPLNYPTRQIRNPAPKWPGSSSTALSKRTAACNREQSAPRTNPCITATRWEPAQQHDLPQQLHWPMPGYGYEKASAIKRPRRTGLCGCNRPTELKVSTKLLQAGRPTLNFIPTSPPVLPLSLKALHKYLFLPGLHPLHTY